MAPIERDSDNRAWDENPPASYEPPTERAATTAGGHTVGDVTPPEIALHERLTAAQCLRNAHGHTATAYAQIDNEAIFTPGRLRRAVRETLDAVDWIRRALEHMEKMGDA